MMNSVRRIVKPPIHCGLASVLFLACFTISCQTVTETKSVADTGPLVDVAGLRCEYLENPAGIDVFRPRLGWRLEAKDPSVRGIRQTAYQILVAGSQEILAQNQGDLWDSGVVESDRSTQVVYEGVPLRSRMRCFWKVRVRDNDGEFSGWSEPASWSMGLLKRSDWSGFWIGIDDVFEKKEGWPPPDNTIPDPWFRKTFEIEHKPERATLYLASIGYHEVYVNGERIGDAILSPNVVNHRKRARYVTYDITEQLQSGRNVLAVWMGLSWSIYPEYAREDRPFTPMFIAQAEIELPDEETVRIVTDETWKTHPSPNTLIGIWNFMHFGGELYDANKEQPNWNKVGYDDSDWDPVTRYAPNVTLSAEMVEPNRISKEIPAVSIKDVGPDEYRVDMGVNFTGWVEIDLSGDQYDRIEFQFSEREDEAMTHRLRSAYIIGPSGKGTFHNRFNYSTGRWIQIKGLDEAPALEDIRGYLVRTDYRRAGRFRCSNELLNRIYDTTLWTYENLSLGGYVVDCPHRERMGYGGDAHATTEMGMNNYRLGAFYTKWSQDWRDVQEPTGDLPYTAPTYWGGGGPAWSGYCITLPWDMYQRYGDVRILDQNFATMQRWLAFLETKAEDNMLRRWGGKWDFLGDWLWPGAEGVNGDTPETLFFNNCYWIYNLQTAAKIASILGREGLAEAYLERADEISQKVHSEFFNPEDNSYANGFQGYLAIALFVDLPPEDLRSAVWKRLEDEILIHRNGHIHAGITAGAFLYKTLLANNRDDLMFEMANKTDYPGWGHMLQEGATTIWEDWERREGHSLLHSSYLYIGTWYIWGLGGIQTKPGHPGFQEFVIHPGVVDDPSLTEVHASYDSLYGPISSDWQRDGNAFSLRISVPPNTTAEVHIPSRSKSVVREGGQSLRSAEGIRSIRRSDGRTVVEVGSGIYSFSAEM